MNSVHAEIEKDRMIVEFCQVRRVILSTTAGSPPEKQERIFLGIWSIIDLLAHLAGWDETNLAAVHSVQAGLLPDFYAFRDKDWQSYNARLVRAYRKSSLAEQISLAESTHAALIAVLRTIPGATWFHNFSVRFRGYRVTIARLIESETHDERVHLKQLEAYITVQ